MNQHVAVPDSGLFVVRATDKHYGMVGVLHFPADFVISECAAYLCMVVGGQLLVRRDPVDRRTYSNDWSGYGVDALLLSQAWSATTAPYTFTARFFQAFPESNGWVFIAASNQPVAPALGFSLNGQAWLSVRGGVLDGAGNEHDAQAAGQSYSGLLRCLVIWPDADGVPHTLPVIESSFRGAYTRVNTLRARVELGEVMPGDMRAVVAGDAQLRHIADVSDRDPGYDRFLAALYKRGLITDECPLRRDETMRREELMRVALTEALHGPGRLCA